MSTSIISEKGQITLPSAIRKKARLSPGTRVEVEFRDGEIVLHPIKRLSELAGIFHQAAMDVSTDYETIRDEMEGLVLGTDYLTKKFTHKYLS